jgi:SAM-dependent methyltransferase
VPRNGLRYPITSDLGYTDRVVLRVGTLAPIHCPVCGRVSAARGFSENLRETGYCARCRATNRNRQVALVACRAASQMCGRTIRALPGLRGSGIVVYNTESQGALHDQLRTLPGYLSSEYLGPQYAPGEVVDGVTHEDLGQLSFADAGIDLVLSSDVFEHVPDPYGAHAEVRRVLRPGGRHVFTVPFHYDRHAHLDDVRARSGPNGEPELLAEPVYHADPVRPQGVLVYTIFGLEMLVRLAEIGFDTRMYRLWDPWRGIVGPNAFVFEAVKCDQAPAAAAGGTSATTTNSL